MSKKGRPFSDNPRGEQYRLRMTKDERDMLEDVCELTGMNKADVLRTAVERMFKEEKFKEEHPLSPLHDKKRKRK